MSTNTNGGTTTSLNNTPQAKDDTYTAYEDQSLILDVMANDLGGNAKVLWSIDDTASDGSADLISKDVVGVSEFSELGASISLTADGKIAYDTSALGSLSILAQEKHRGCGAMCFSSSLAFAPSAAALPGA